MMLFRQSCFRPEDLWTKLQVYQAEILPKSRVTDWWITLRSVGQQLDQLMRWLTLYDDLAQAIDRHLGCFTLIDATDLREVRKRGNRGMPTMGNAAVGRKEIQPKTCIG
jgi:hypothetical protein